MITVPNAGAEVGRDWANCVNTAGDCHTARDLSGATEGRQAVPTAHHEEPGLPSHAVPSSPQGSEQTEAPATLAASNPGIPLYDLARHSLATGTGAHKPLGVLSRRCRPPGAGDWQGSVSVFYLFYRDPCQIPDTRPVSPPCIPPCLLLGVSCCSMCGYFGELAGPRPAHWGFCSS